MRPSGDDARPCARPARRRWCRRRRCTPARNSSATTSMIPEPHTPVMPAGGRCAVEPGLVRPAVAADHLDAGLERVPVDAHPLDGARRRPLPARDLRAFERGAGRARRGEQPLPLAEHDLGVRADVDEELHLVAAVRALGEDGRRGVGADVAGDAGQDVEAGAAAAHADVRRPGRRRPGRWRARTAPSRAASGRCRAARWCMIGLPTAHHVEHVVALDARRRRSAARRARRPPTAPRRSAGPAPPGSSSRTRPGSSGPRRSGSAGSSPRRWRAPRR